VRIYLGYAPGAGTACALLSEARRRAEHRADVVVASADTHGRPHTEGLLAGLEVIAPAKVLYRGALAEEMDLGAVLARGPAVALVDDFAHRNAPGSRHHGRWQDVGDLLAAGIEVISTVSAGHLDSLADVVAKITGAAPRRTVPDPVVRAAPEVELVDGGTWGMNLLPVIEDAERVLLVDAIDVGATSGTEVQIPRERLPRYLATKISPHQVDLSDVLALAELRGTLPEHTTAIGLQPARVALSNELSDIVRVRLDDLVAGVVRQLESWGHLCTPKGALASCVSTGFTGGPSPHGPRPDGRGYDADGCGCACTK